jgi:hypothetical protein
LFSLESTKWDEKQHFRWRNHESAYDCFQATRYFAFP